MIALYWDLGKPIEERQVADGWGKSVVEKLTRDLRAEFGEKSGYSVQNLWYMRKFYREYKDMPNLQPLAGDLAWTKNTLILDRCQNAQERKFDLRATARLGWTRRVLDHQSDGNAFEKYLLNQTSFDAALPKALASLAKYRTVVEYALKITTMPIGVTTYGTSSRLPEAYRHLLPTEQEIAERLKDWHLPEAEC